MRTWTYTKAVHGRSASTGSLPSVRHRIGRLFSGNHKRPLDEMPDEAESTSNAVPANEIYWPYHLLPADCMTARILVWGYDTVVTRGYTRSANKSNLFAHAKDLLYSLERE